MKGNSSRCSVQPDWAAAAVQRAGLSQQTSTCRRLRATVTSSPPSGSCPNQAKPRDTTHQGQGEDAPVRIALRNASPQHCFSGVKWIHRMLSEAETVARHRRFYHNHMQFVSTRYDRGAAWCKSSDIFPDRAGFAVFRHPQFASARK